MKKPAPQKPPRLTLARETLTALDARQLIGLVAGNPPTSIFRPNFGSC